LIKSMSVSVGSASTSMSPGKMGAVRCLVRIDWGRLLFGVQF